MTYLSLSLHTNNSLTLNTKGFIHLFFISDAKRERERESQAGSTIYYHQSTEQELKVRILVLIYKQWVSSAFILNYQSLL